MSLSIVSMGHVGYISPTHFPQIASSTNIVFTVSSLQQQQTNKQKNRPSKRFLVSLYRLPALKTWSVLFSNFNWSTFKGYYYKIYFLQIYTWTIYTRNTQTPYKYLKIHYKLKLQTFICHWGAISEMAECEGEFISVSFD